MIDHLDQWQFTNSFAQLPADFHESVQAESLHKPFLIDCNLEVAIQLGLSANALDPEVLAQYFGGHKQLKGAQPVAALYAGHQFGHYVQQLGDGRAMLLAEIRTEQQQNWELQLKGSGRTPFSRQGDGRAVLRSSIREYLASAAMTGLGIPTTQALCLIGSEEEVYREKLEMGASILRVAPSHIRFGNFEVFYYRQQYEQLQILADYVIEHHYPELNATTDKYLQLLQIVSDRTADLIAQWQLVGFAHGVMNTDNMSILGLTLDYGPFAFLDNYQPDFICNHSDVQGRYAFNQQPHIGLWNLSCLAQTLLPLINFDQPELAAKQAETVLASYQHRFSASYQTGMHKKLGLEVCNSETEQLITDILPLMAKQKVDFTIFFRQLAYPKADIAVLFKQDSVFLEWWQRYQQQINIENRDPKVRYQQMNAVNPKYILRNYLAQTAIQQAEQGDFSEIEHLMHLLADPYAEHSQYEPYAADPPAWSQEISISCSS